MAEEAARVNYFGAKNGEVAQYYFLCHSISSDWSSFPKEEAVFLPTYHDERRGSVAARVAELLLANVLRYFFGHFAISSYS